MLGALALVVQSQGIKRAFFVAMVIAGSIGGYFAVRAFMLAANAG